MKANTMGGDRPRNEGDAKQCRDCLKIKPLDEFHLHPRGSMGRFSYCKPCSCERVRASRSKNIEHYREFDRKRAKTPERMERERLRSRRRRITESEKVKARTMVNHAIRAGRLTRGPCDTCGETKGTHGHHDDYSKPLDVRWLCEPCHTAHHAKERRDAPKRGRRAA